MKVEPRVHLRCLVETMETSSVNDLGLMSAVRCLEKKKKKSSSNQVKRGTGVVRERVT